MIANLFLMEKVNKDRISNMKRFSLDDFVVTYIDYALDKLRESPMMNAFDEHMRKEISEIFNIDYNLVKGLSNAFHWELFLKGRDLAEYVQSTKDGEEATVGLKRDYDENDAISLKKKIISKYELLLKCSREHYLTNLKNR